VIVTTPEETPVAVAPLIEAIAGLLLVHVPPPTVLVKVVDEPTHTLVAPPIAAGAGLTVTGVLAVQPVAVTE
jgi:hypothetical protein